jgi:thiol-disulfide isomerase/thioredoxin
MRLLGLLLLVAALGAAYWLFAVPRPRAPVSEAGGRSQTVTPEQAAHAAPVAKPPPDAGAVEETREAKDDGPLCDRTYTAEDGPLIDVSAAAVVRPGGDTPAGAWTWVNLWAAWCAPCIAEMPLLEQWAKAQGEAGRPVRLLLVSVDDDPRQLRRFIDGPKGQALGSRVLHVPEGEARTRLMAALELTDPPLPVQAVLDPKGRLRCLRMGTVTEASLETAAQTLLR